MSLLSILTLSDVKREFEVTYTVRLMNVLLVITGAEESVGRDSNFVED